MGDLTENFNSSEFTCRCPENCDWKTVNHTMSKDLLLLLQYVRSSLGRTVVINSGLRCPKWNKQVGSGKDSAHVKGLAVDIKCTTPRDRYELLERVLDTDVKRVGIDRGFIHIDLDKDKTQDIVWTY